MAHLALSAGRASRGESGRRRDRLKRRSKWQQQQQQQTRIQLRCKWTKLLTDGGQRRDMEFSNSQTKRFFSENFDDQKLRIQTRIPLIVAAASDWPAADWT